jgi:uncharacterized protein YabN with tetrapyrrole methylase and pyrophosphatase domain
MAKEGMDKAQKDFFLREQMKAIKKELGEAGEEAEEFEELRQALAGGSREAVREEIGDLLFTLVNVSRFVQVDAELALREAVAKFVRRFTRMEEGLRRLGRTLEEASMEEMDALWEEVKRDDR